MNKILFLAKLPALQSF